MTDDERMIEEAFKSAEAHSQSVKRAAIPITPDEQREGFARNTGLAIEAYRQILSLDLDECDPFYKAKLQAKSTVASQQLIAALRADENRLKAAVVERDYYLELKAALDAYQAKQGAKQLEYKEGRE